MTENKITLGGQDVEAENILIVGEYTTEDGPLMDDHFLIVILNDGRAVEIALNGAESDSEFLTLAQALGVQLNLQLCDRTDFSSVVIYPISFSGRQLFIPKSIGQLPKSRLEFLFKSMSRQEWVLDGELINQIAGLKKRGG